MGFALNIVIMVGIYIILSVSFNLLMGYAGVFAMCHAAFYGIGAYISTLVFMNLGWSFIPAMLAGMLGAAAISFVLSIPALRVHWEYMVILSFGFQFMVYYAMMNWVSLTNGPLGITGIPRPTLFGFTFSSNLSYLGLVTVFALLVVLVAWRIGESPYGRVLKAIREDELAVAALGKNVFRYKVSIFVIAGALAAVAGALVAHYIRYIVPYYFGIHESFLIIFLVVLGGSGNLWGGVVGAVVLITIPELLRLLPIPSEALGGTRQLLYGLILILFMVFRPWGILPERVKIPKIPIGSRIGGNKPQTGIKMREPHGIN